MARRRQRHTTRYTITPSPPTGRLGRRKKISLHYRRRFIACAAPAYFSKCSQPGSCTLRCEHRPSGAPARGLHPSTVWRRTSTAATFTNGGGSGVLRQPTTMLLLRLL